MRLSIAVIIPTLNEQAHIAAAIASARRIEADEIIVVDGGSSDRTEAEAITAGARFVKSTTALRSVQLNEGAQAVTSELLIFLHADTVLPAEARARIEAAVSHGYDCGGFRLRFAERSARLRIAARLINLRTRLTRCPWGDHAQFATRAAFDDLQGFRKIELMEDYDFALRARKERMPVILEAFVTTSGRRFLRRGLLRTAVTNWRIIAGFHLGENPARLAARYRRS